MCMRKFKIEPKYFIKSALKWFDNEMIAVRTIAGNAITIK